MLFINLLYFKPFDEIAEGSIKIRNLGKVDINFSMIGLEKDDENIEPDKPIIYPSKVC